MSEPLPKRLLPVRTGILLALLTLLYGFGLGGAFGAFEDSIKGHLKAEGDGYLARAATEDPKALKAKVDATVSKSWTYMKRAHLHANGLGTSALAMILLLSLLGAADRTKMLTSIALGVGALGYSMFWMLAALRAPGMGSTGAAKESLKWLAVPTSFLCVLGLATVIVLFVRTAYLRAHEA